MRLEDMILRPIITEKASKAADEHNYYTFAVDIRANKNQIRQAIEKCYGVKATKIKTNIRPGKLKRIGRVVKKEGKLKWAAVRLPKGQKIEYF